MTVPSNTNERNPPLWIVAMTGKLIASDYVSPDLTAKGVNTSPRGRSTRHILSTKSSDGDRWIANHTAHEMPMRAGKTQLFSDFQVFQQVFHWSQRAPLLYRFILPQTKASRDGYLAWLPRSLGYRRWALTAFFIRQLTQNPPEFTITVISCLLPLATGCLPLAACLNCHAL